jgi:amino acid adenylation domain-containing protein
MRINVLEYLEQGALARHGDRTALLHEDKACTFSRLASLARKCASSIIGRSDATRRPIAVFLPRSIEAVVADLGIVYSGNCYMNLDVNSPAQRISSILSNVDPLFVITSREQLQEVAALGICGERLLMIDEVYDQQTQCDGAEIARRRGSAIDTDPVCVINTSGSTGVPKSVVVSHRSVIDFTDWVLDRFDFDEHDIIGSLSPFHFDHYTLDLYVALARGAKLVIIPTNYATFPVRLVEYLAAERASFVFFVPFIMVNIANMGLLDKVDLRCLKKIFFAGEVFPTKQFNIWRKHIPDAMFVNLYGPTEITTDCTYYVVDREFKDDEPLPIGVPCRNTDILILNEKDQPAKANEIGELCVRGSCLAMGYWNNAEKTNRAFVQNPLNPHYPEVIYRTGDLSYRNERGEIVFVGRKDYQIKHLGYRIEMGEIENAVGSLEEIDNACVLYHTKRKEITLFFTAREQLRPSAIRRMLAEKLPKYMLPTVFHQLDAMPRNPNGKIDRQWLTRSYLEADGSASPAATARQVL